MGISVFCAQSILIALFACCISSLAQENEIRYETNFINGINNKKHYSLKYSNPSSGLEGWNATKECNDANMNLATISISENNSQLYSIKNFEDELVAIMKSEIKKYVTIWMYIDLFESSRDNEDQGDSVSGSEVLPLMMISETKDFLFTELRNNSNYCFCFSQKNNLEMYWCHGVNCKSINAALCENEIQINVLSTSWNWNTFWIVMAATLVMVNVAILAIWCVCRSQRQLSKPIEIT